MLHWPHWVLPVRWPLRPKPRRLRENTLTQVGATYVLVHGTWHGGWVWRDVADRLIAQGHRVFTPTCTGCGERLHLTGPEVGLETHIDDIVNVIEYEELSNVILVGHSFSGITITGVADRLRERIERIVFFDALVPRPGRMSGVTKDLATGEYPAWWRARQQHFIEGYQMDLWQDYPYGHAGAARLSRCGGQVAATHYPPPRQTMD